MFAAQIYRINDILQEVSELIINMLLIGDKGNISSFFTWSKHIKNSLSELECNYTFSNIHTIRIIKFVSIPITDE